MVFLERNLEMIVVVLIGVVVLLLRVGRSHSGGLSVAGCLDVRSAALLRWAIGDLPLAGMTISVSRCGSRCCIGESAVTKTEGMASCTARLASIEQPIASRREPP